MKESGCQTGTLAVYDLSPFENVWHKAWGIQGKLLEHTKRLMLIKNNWKKGWGHAGTYCKNIVFIGNYTNSAPPDAHGGYHCPLVGLWAVKLTRLEAHLPIKTTKNVNLRGAKRQFINLALFWALTFWHKTHTFRPLSDKLWITPGNQHYIMSL